MDKFVLMVTVVCKLTIPTCQLITRLTKQGKTLLKYPKTTKQLHLLLTASDKTTTHFYSSNKTTVINPKVTTHIPEKADMNNFFFKYKLKILNKLKIDTYNLRIDFVAEKLWAAACKDHFLLQTITGVYKQKVHT